MIKERAEKDYNAILRGALTSIPKVNKTDVETLRSTFGVCPESSQQISSSVLTTRQSFANISQATPEQLRNLPGFGQVKVKNIENAFNKPFRNDAMTKLTQLRSEQSQPQEPPRGTDSAARQASPSTSSQQPPREPSPTWDIELDLNDDEILTALDGGSTTNKYKST